MAVNIEKVLIVHGGELAHDVAQRIEKTKPASLANVAVSIQSGSERPKKLLDYGEDTVVCFVVQTIENASPTEDGGMTTRFFQRKTHSQDILQGKFRFAILGLGDSNLLLDRQTTAAKDCNQVAQELDLRLSALGGKKQYEVGLADERTGLTEVEPWINNFWESFSG
mmetsp:Transcript_39292/g.91705  ORF Transcript_39292/g.91705 Transcript_39292/m.91705 type:complete len:167 (-) Transcript_39292:162-662(-)